MSRYAGMTTQAVSFKVCCDRIGISYRTGERMIADGTFPIPELPRRAPKSPHRYSTTEIESYLTLASTADVRRRMRRTVAA